MMSIQFDQPMNDESKKLIDKFFGDKVVAYDHKTVLLEGLNQINQGEFKAISNEAKQPATLSFHGQGEIVGMQDGTKYQVIKQGWEKI